MSGDVSLRRPRSTKWQEALLRENLKHLGLEDLNSSEAIEKLRAISAVEIVHAIPLFQHWSPTLDYGLLTGFRDRDFYIENSWCKHILMGDMAHDVSHSWRAYAVTKPTNRCSVGYNSAFTIFG